MIVFREERQFWLVLGNKKPPSFAIEPCRLCHRLGVFFHPRLMSEIRRAKSGASKRCFLLSCNRVFFSKQKARKKKSFAVESRQLPHRQRQIFPATEPTQTNIQHTLGVTRTFPEVSKKLKNTDNSAVSFTTLENFLRKREPEKKPS